MNRHFKRLMRVAAALVVVVVLYLVLAFVSEKMRYHEAIQLSLICDSLSRMGGDVDQWALEERKKNGAPLILTGSFREFSDRTVAWRSRSRFAEYASFRWPQRVGQAPFAITNRRLLHFPAGTKAILWGVQRPGAPATEWEYFNLNALRDPVPSTWWIPFMWMHRSVALTPAVLFKYDLSKYDDFGAGSLQP